MSCYVNIRNIWRSVIQHRVTSAVVTIVGLSLSLLSLFIKLTVTCFHSPLWNCLRMMSYVSLHNLSCCIFEIIKHFPTPDSWTIALQSELKRLYTQLQIYKTKAMRKDNPHISKRRGGRKQTHRRFSLQAFHHKHHKYHHEPRSDFEHELSKTPEESTNSAEGVAISMAEESSIGECRTPTVTFKPGHKSMF